MYKTKELLCLILSGDGVELLAILLFGNQLHLAANLLCILTNSKRQNIDLNIKKMCIGIQNHKPHTYHGVN